MNRAESNLFEGALYDVGVGYHAPTATHTVEESDPIEIGAGAKVTTWSQKRAPSLNARVKRAILAYVKRCGIVPSTLAEVCRAVECRGSTIERIESMLAELVASGDITRGKATHPKVRGRKIAVYWYEGG